VRARREPGAGRVVIVTATLEARVRRLEDRQELSDLVARYGRVVDDRDADALRELYAADAVFDAVAGPITGRDAVVDYYRQRFHAYGPSFHVPHSQTVEFLDDDEATGVVTAHAELAMPEGTFWVALRYQDRYVRGEGRWRFRERRVQQLYAMPLRELLDDLGAPDRLRWPGRPTAPADLPEETP